MADFNFFLNRQGVRGNKGEQGEQGYSPRITVKTETAAEYVLNVQNEDGSFDTPNLRGNAIENLGGTYVRFDQDTEQMYTGYADTASTTSQGEVVLSTYEDLASGGDESEVTTSKDVHDFVETKISEASVNYVDIDDYTQKMGELDSKISDLDENKLDFTDLSNALVAGTNITITSNTQTGKITIAGELVDQAQADWNQTDTDAPDYIKNKPTIPEAITVDSELSATSTNPVQNRLITNAINLISNEFENYATNKLDNLTNEGEARLHALKAYSDNGELLTDTKGLADVIKYAHSTFDSSKFTTVGSLTIVDGIASGFVSQTNYITGSFTTVTATNKIDLWCKCYAASTTANGSVLFAITNNLRLVKNNSTTFGVRGLSGSLLVNTPTLILSDGDEVILHAIITDTTVTLESWINGVKQNNGVSTGDYSGILTTYNAFVIGGQYSNGNYSPNETIDLKYCKAIIDGVLVFSGNKTGVDTYTINGSTITIPYTESITGSKVALADSRQNIATVATVLGSANYYTLDEGNGNFTLPQVELYGLIEKAASTVPSGVVQSSTIRNIVSLTQAEYDALTTKDANTFYVITPST